MEFSAFNYIGKAPEVPRVQNGDDSDEIDKQIDQLNQSLPLDEQLSDIDIKADLDELIQFDSVH